MLHHCSIATATEYPMLSLRHQDAVFGMIWSMRKDTGIQSQPLNGMNFDFLQFCLYVLQLETAAAAAA